MTYNPDFDFIGNAQRLNVVMQALESVDLDGIISTVEFTHTMGPIIDPTAYRDALDRGDMDSLLELAKALQPAVKVWNEKIKPKMSLIGGEL